MGPACFDILATSSPSTLLIIQQEMSFAEITMSVDMPIRDLDLDIGIGIQLHLVRKLQCTLSKFFRPLTPDIIGENNEKKLYTNQCRKDNIVRVAVSGTCRLDMQRDIIKE
jgi:hypothetical protein